jgi:trimethylamine--corrinoid protein Co-methyltransferase
VIREAGFGGSFLAADHTVRHFRQELYFPFLFQRKTIDQWVAEGCRMAHELAHDRVEEILAKAGPAPLPPEVDRALEQALNRALSETSRTTAG